MAHQLKGGSLGAEGWEGDMSPWPAEAPKRLTRSSPNRLSTHWSDEGHTAVPPPLPWKRDQLQSFLCWAVTWPGSMAAAAVGKSAWRSAAGSHFLSPACRPRARLLSPPTSHLPTGVARACCNQGWTEGQDYADLPNPGQGMGGWGRGSQTGFSPEPWQSQASQCPAQPESSFPSRGYNRSTLR